MDQLPETSDAEDSSPLGVIVGAIGTYLGKIPPALQRNISKAVGHLFKVPNAYLDGLADEIKATSEARIKITKATGNKLAQAVEIDSSLAQIAAQTHANKILRQQKNTIKVLKHAAEEISSMPSEPNSEQPPEITDDWLNAFESEAVNMSSEQMQKLFGKMLAGEIRSPATFSIRTIKLMGQMDVDVADVFQKFCSITTACRVAKTVVDGRVLTLGASGTNALYHYGIPHTQIRILAEYGLISHADPLSFPYDICVFREKEDGKPRLPLTYNDTEYVLVPQAPKTSDDFADFMTFGIALSRVGRELLNIVEIRENATYTEAFKAFFSSQGLLAYALPNENVERK